MQYWRACSSWRAPAALAQKTSINEKRSNDARERTEVRVRQAETHAMKERLKKHAPPPVEKESKREPRKEQEEGFGHDLGDDQVSTEVDDDAQESQEDEAKEAKKP